jgi:DNA primase
MASYKEVKEKIRILQVLEFYGVQTVRKGKQLAGKCPWCGGSGFKVSPEKNCYKCFSGGCTHYGNILDFVSQLDRITIQQAAQKLHDTFLSKPEAPAVKPRQSVVSRFKALFS